MGLHAVYTGLEAWPSHLLIPRAGLRGMDPTTHTYRTMLSFRSQSKRLTKNNKADKVVQSCDPSNWKTGQENQELTSKTLLVFKNSKLKQTVTSGHLLAKLITTVIQKYTERNQSYVYCHFLLNEIASAHLPAPLHTSPALFSCVLLHPLCW